MREQDHLAALVGELGDGRRDALDTGRVGDLAVLNRHVEVDAQQHALVGDVGLIKCAKLRHRLTRAVILRCERSEPRRMTGTGWGRILRGPHKERGHLRMTAQGFRSAFPSRPPCRSYGWRNPTRCRTTTAPPPWCRPSLWSGPCGRPTSARRD